MPLPARPSVRRTAATAVLALLAGLLTALLGAPASAALPTGWVGTWGASPMAGQDNGCTDCTIRNVIRISKGGAQVRVTLSNRFGTGPLRIGAATVARPATSTTAKVRAGTMRTLLFGGAEEVVIPAGATATSDPADLVVEDAGSILVTTYTPGYTTPMTVHDIGSQLSFFARGRDATHDEGAGAFPERTEDRHFVTRVDVRGESAGTVVAFGDSITDGVGSGQNNNTRYPDFLAARLSGRPEQLGVVNSGISGNRVLLDGTGERALDRFDRDVLDVPGVRSVVILEGINDINNSPNGTDVPALTAGLQDLIDRAHADGVRVVLGTLTPYRGWGQWSPEREAARVAVNQWIRSHQGVEGIADFDAAVRNPSAPDTMLPVYDSGDRLHPGDAGYAAMADAVPLDALADPFVPDPPTVPEPPTPTVPPVTVPPTTPPSSTSPSVETDVRIRVTGTRVGRRPRANLRPSAAGSVRLTARRGNVRVVRVVAVAPGSAHQVPLPRKLTRRAGRLVVTVVLDPTAATDLPSRSTHSTVVR